MENFLDLYTDYLISSFGQTSSTGLSNVLDGAIKHDSFTYLLSKSKFSSKDLWLTVKPLVREHQNSSACLIFDDTIIEKLYTDENDLICWHWDHSKGRNVKGINLLSAFYHTQKDAQSMPVRLPIAFEMIKKTVHFCDLKTKKEKRASPISKNELMQQMISQAITNGLFFKYILADSWFASSENMRFINQRKKYFIFDLQSNRLAALTEADRNKGSWTNINELEIPDNVAVKVWLKDLEFPVLLTKQILTNKDNSSVIRFLVSNDFSLSDEQFSIIYKKRWSVEEYHKSLKQNVSIAMSPTRKIVTQSNHVYASILAYIKLEKMKFINKLNHFEMKTKIYHAAVKAALNQLYILKQCP